MTPLVRLIGGFSFSLPDSGAKDINQIIQNIFSIDRISEELVDFVSKRRLQVHLPYSYEIPEVPAGIVL